MTPAQTLERHGAPPALRAALEGLVSELAKALGPDLAGVTVFGDVAKGRWRGPGHAVHVAVLLRQATREVLERAAPALRGAWREARVEPFLLTPAEVRAAADVFPTKLLDIQRHHATLCGEDPFHDLVVHPEHLRLRVEQELRNVALRLRRTYVGVAGDPGRLRAELADVVETLSVNLAELLRLRGQEVRDDAPGPVFAQAAAALDLDAPALRAIEELARPAAEGAPAARPPAPDELQALFGRLLATTSRAADVVDEHRGATA